MKENSEDPWDTNQGVSELVTVSGIGHTWAKELKNGGITRKKQLVDLDPAELDNLAINTGLSLDRLNGLIKRVKLSMLTDAKWIKKLIFPRIEECIFFDIETDIDYGMIWMIGVQRNNEITQYTAMNWDEEGKILSEFGKYLLSYPGAPLICYSTTNFDFRLVWNACKRLELNDVLNSMKNRSWIDLAIALRRVYYPLNGTFKLKELALQLGYKFRHDDLDGMEVSLRYSALVSEHIKLNEDQIIEFLEYNADDIKSMVHMLKTFWDNVEVSEPMSSLFTPEKARFISTKLVSIRRTQKRISLSVKPEDFNDVYENIVSGGITLPTIAKSQNLQRLYWDSKIGKERAEDLLIINDIDVRT